MREKDRPDKAKIAQPSEPVGCPLAPGMIVLLEDEIKEGLKRREIEARFAQFAAYAASILDSSAGDRSWSEMAGNCRLSWYDKLYRNPLKATAEAERFTRKLHQAVLASRSGTGPSPGHGRREVGLEDTKSPTSGPSGIAGRSP